MRGHFRFKPLNTQRLNLIEICCRFKLSVLCWKYWRNTVHSPGLQLVGSSPISPVHKNPEGHEQRRLSLQHTFESKMTVHWSLCGEWRSTMWHKVWVEHISKSREKKKDGFAVLDNPRAYAPGAVNTFEMLTLKSEPAPHLRSCQADSRKAGNHEIG